MPSPFWTKQADVVLLVAVWGAFAACGEASDDATSDGVYRIVSTLEVGEAPHGIRFSAGGDTAYVALSGEGRIAVVDVAARSVAAKWPAGTTPLDLIQTRDGWLVSQFRDSTLITLDRSGAIVPDNVWGVGAGPSLFTPSGVRGHAWITSEFSDQLWDVDLATGVVNDWHPTGDRPYPADVMWDGSYAFVPNLEDGTVTVVDLLNAETDATVQVCDGPAGGALTIDDVSYMVACGGSNEVVFINTASFEVTHRISDGLGERPFSIVPTADGLHALVINAGGNTISVVDLRAGAVAQRIEVGEQPIVVRAHPDGRRIFAANEVSGTLVELAPTVSMSDPGSLDRGPQLTNQVVMLGMIHGGHETSEAFSLDVVRDLVREINPDYWLTEIPPNRWERAWGEFQANGVVEEPRVSRFPEYMEVLFPLSRELDFVVVPTAGWTEPMSDFRAQYLNAYAEDPARADTWAQYTAASAASAAALAVRPGDDPRWIHTDAYDEAYDIRMKPYQDLFGAEIGPGGWDAINASHWGNIERALEAHSGEGVRLLITYGAGHKGPFLRELRKRTDVELLDVADFLDAIGR